MVEPQNTMWSIDLEMVYPLMHRSGLYPYSDSVTRAQKMHLMRDTVTHSDTMKGK